MARLKQLNFRKRKKCFSLMHQLTTRWRYLSNSGLPKVIFLAVAEAEGEGGKTSALEVEAEGEAKGLVFCI